MGPTCFSNRDQLLWNRFAFSKQIFTAELRKAVACRDCFRKYPPSSKISPGPASRRVKTRGLKRQRGGVPSGPVTVWLECGSPGKPASPRVVKPRLEHVSLLRTPPCCPHHTQTCVFAHTCSHAQYLRQGTNAHRSLLSAPLLCLDFLKLNRNQ